MVWTIAFHPNVYDDLRSLGRVEANTVIKVIEERIVKGEPDKSGKPLHGRLAGFRRMRTGDIRIVYRVNKGRIEVMIIAVGMRRDDEVYEKALSRTE